MYTMIQSLTKHNRRAIVRLLDDAYVSPAGYIVGPYRLIYPSLTREASIKMLARLFQAGKPCSLWWTGAAEDIAQHLDIE